MLNNQIAFSFRCVTDEWNRIEGTDIEVSWGGHTYDQQGRLIFTLLARPAEQAEQAKDTSGGDT